MQATKKRITIANHGRLITAKQDSMGNITITPTTNKLWREIQDYHKAAETKLEPSHFEAFLQGQEVQDFIDNVPVRHLHSFDRGYEVSFYVTDELAWSLFGLEY